DDDACSYDGRNLRRDAAESDRRSAGAGTARRRAHGRNAARAGRRRGALRAAPVRDRQRQRHEDERLQRPPLRALTLREAMAVRAGAQVRTKRTPLAQRKPSVELAVDCSGRFLAADVLLELLPQRAPRAEEERLERG